MIALLILFFGTGLRKDADDATVTLDEIEERLRSLSGGVRDVVLSSKRNTIAAGALGAIASIAGAYLHGRRRGRRRATILEVERR